MYAQGLYKTYVREFGEKKIEEIFYVGPVNLSLGVYFK
jgi:hypothetical protein